MSKLFSYKNTKDANRKQKKALLSQEIISLQKLTDSINNFRLAYKTYDAHELFVLSYLADHFKSTPKYKDLKITSTHEVLNDLMIILDDQPNDLFRSLNKSATRVSIKQLLEDLKNKFSTHHLTDLDSGGLILQEVKSSHKFTYPPTILYNYNRTTSEEMDLLNLFEARNLELFLSLTKNFTLMEQEFDTVMLKKQMSERCCFFINLPVCLITIEKVSLLV
tara:strand:- start:6786 stop:7448 length:663 start_codon:yes stop_codon:yes gene_type:complete